jgi:hypothetical protein
MSANISSRMPFFIGRSCCPSYSSVQARLAREPETHSPPAPQPVVSGPALPGTSASGGKPAGGCGRYHRVASRRRCRVVSGFTGFRFRENIGRSWLTCSAAHSLYAPAWQQAFGSRLTPIIMPVETCRKASPRSSQADTIRRMF